MPIRKNKDIPRITAKAVSTPPTKFDTLLILIFLNCDDYL